MYVNTGDSVDSVYQKIIDIDQYLLNLGLFENMAYSRDPVFIEPQCR